MCFLACIRLTLERASQERNKDAEMGFVQGYSFQNMVRHSQAAKRLASLFILADVDKPRGGEIEFECFTFILYTFLLITKKKKKMEFGSVEWKGRNNRHHKPQLELIGGSIWEARHLRHP